MSSETDTQVSRDDLCNIFYAVRSTMVNDQPKPGIFKELACQLSYDSNTIWRQWKKMEKKLAILLNNQPEEDHIGIIAAGSHILFATNASIRVSAETDEILATLRGTANNNDLDIL
jgi:hypothetical protein